MEQKLVYFNYAAFFLLIVIIASGLYNKMQTTKANRVFLLVLLEVFVTTCFDIGAVYLDNMGPGNIALKYFFHTGYLTFHTATSLCYLLYLITLTDTWHSFRATRARTLLLWVPITLNFLMYPVGWIIDMPKFFISDAGIYTRGPIFLGNYVVGAIYLIYGCYYIVRYKNLFDRKRMIALFAPYPFIAISMIIEFLNPYIIIELFFNALGLMFIFNNIQATDKLFDPVTGFGNSDALESYCRKAYYNQKPVSAIIVDITNFKGIVDMIDYEIFQDFKREIAGKIREIDRKLALGSEMYYGQKGRFYMLVEQKNSDKVEEAAMLVLGHINQSAVLEESGLRPIPGIIIANIPVDIKDFSDFMTFADGKLGSSEENEITYAKDIFATDEGKISLSIDRIIAEALDGNRFEVYYQPIFSIEERKLKACEALIRLKDPEFGMISPEFFIPAAEQNGLIFQIDEFVLRSVCEFIASGELEQNGVDYVEVNLSAVQCVRMNMAEEFISIIKEYGVRYDQIAVEITETALAFDAEMVKMNLEKLAVKGIKVCLDDYGTGYSDTRRIMDLPLSIVKLDKTYLRDCERKPVRTVIIGTIALLKSLGLCTVAEGVEDEAELGLLEEAQCDDIQGFYFSKPLPRAEFTEFVANNNLI